MTGGKTINARTVFAVCFLTLMIMLGSAAIFAYTQRHLGTILPEFKTDVPAVMTFKALYPFDDAADEDEAPERRDLMSFIRAYRNALEGYLANRNLLSKYIYRFCLWNEDKRSCVIANGNRPLVRLANGHLTYAYSPSRESWGMVRKWNIWLNKRNIPLLQILPATKMDDEITEFPPGVPRGYARMMEQYKRFLTANNIPFLDAKDLLLAAGNDFYSWFYKTDHHWNVFAGRLVAEATAKKLNDEFGVATDVGAVREANFKLIRYPSVFMGSMAVKAGASPEDFEIFYSRKEGRFLLKIPSLGMNRVGCFNDTLIVQTFLKYSWKYNCFLYGDHPLIRIENKDCTNGTRVLVVKHSQANVVCPYLACAVQYLDIIDPRRFDGSIKSFIEQTRPDIVLTCI